MRCVDPVVLNEIGKINVVCEWFVIAETHDVYTLVLESLFQMSTSRNKKNVYAIFDDEFMTQNILEFIGIHNKRILHDHFHLKLNFEKLLICK